MAFFIYVLTVLTAVAGLIWLTRHLEVGQGNRLVARLNSSQYAGPGDANYLPRISVLIAAKDEEANIEACIRSWMRQDYPDFEIVVTDDRSTDRTAGIIDRLAAEDRRVRALHVTELRPGWFGKNNAMREGVEKADGEWFCFSDADCVQESNRSLIVSMRHAQEHRSDLLSVLPLMDLRSFWERVIQPACGAVMMVWFNPIKVNNPRSRAAYANGAFMLMSRTAYQRIGGHEPVKSEVNEDVHMARRIKEAGLSLRVASNEDLYRVRMYDGFRQAWRGWSRIFYGCFGTFRRLVVTLAAVTVVSLLPWLTLAVTATMRAAGKLPTGSATVLFWTAAATCFFQITVLLRFYKLSRVSPLLALTYPIGAGIAFGMLVSAIRRLRGRSTTTWRGTVYRGASVEPGVAAPPTVPSAGPEVSTAIHTAQENG